MRKDEIVVAGLLVDPVRRRIFQFVRRSRRPVTRDEVAAAARVARNLAAFHLDKLVEAGLLRAGTRTSAGPGAGRPPKVYEPGPVEVHLDVPPRQHGLLAGVLAEALTAGGGVEMARRLAAEAAGRHGRDLGRDAAGLRAVLERLGFEPYDAGQSVLRLGNCPFHPLPVESRELVCGLNRSLIGGLLAGLGREGLSAVLAPRAGECCVEIRRTSDP